MRFNRFQFAQTASTDPITENKDCTQCADMKDYAACTCDPEMAVGLPPNSEGCTFVLGNENAPAQNAKPAWSEFATSNTVRVAEGTIQAKREAAAAKVVMPAQQNLFRYRQDECDENSYGPECRNPLRQTMRQDKCDEGDLVCLSQVSQDAFDCTANPDRPGCEVYRQSTSRFQETVMNHVVGAVPGEQVWAVEQNVIFKQSAEQPTCVGPSGPNDCVF